MSNSFDILTETGSDLTRKEALAADTVAEIADDAVSSALGAVAARGDALQGDELAKDKSGEDLSGPPQRRGTNALESSDRGEPTDDAGDETINSGVQVTDVGHVALASASGGNAHDGGKGYGGVDRGPDESDDNEGSDSQDATRGRRDVSAVVDRWNTPIPRDFVKREISEDEAVQLDFARQEAIDAVYSVGDQLDEGDVLRGTLTALETQRANISWTLIDENMPPRRAVEADEERLALAFEDASPIVIAAEQAAAEAQLDLTRQILHHRSVPEIDDVQVDERLGLRSESPSVLPEHFKQLHHQAEAASGDQLSFLTWMESHATDEQLLNVLQWNDHYLRTNDDDPAFQAQVARVEQNYANGLDAAIAAQVLHQSVAHPETRDVTTYWHGSPLAVLMGSGHNAYVDHERGAIVVKAGATDIQMNHERAHLDGGLGPLFSEAATELIARTTYNYSHSPEEHYGPEAPHYTDNIATLVAIDNMTEGRIGLIGISEFFAGGDVDANGVAFLMHADDLIGAPVGTQILLNGKAMFEEFASHFGGRDATLMVHLSIRMEAELLESVLVDEQGHRRNEPLTDTLYRVMTDEHIDEYGIATCMRAQKTLALGVLYKDDDVDEAD